MASGAGALPAGAAPPPQQPAAIQRLDDAVVHRIAAGEVVQRPASALKEMLENSIDAGARHITVVVKEGGLKYLQIQDDGCGIRLQDLPILCHRHTTSKLRAFEDLETISTLGFRGEALASISFVAHVSVTTMTPDMPHGYRVAYSDGEPLPPGPKPVAAVPGTSIIVEDMFYNMLPRRRAFKPGPEEHNLLQDVLQRYAVHKAGSVGFTLKRQGEARSDLHTLPSASRLDVIRSLYGPQLAASLLPLSLTGGSGDVSAAVALDGPMGFTAQGYVSALTHMGRRSVLVLFINGRPVEQGQLRRAIEGVYAAHNPKATKPWVYLDLRLPPRHVEVNLHPTKREVGFLHQQQVIDDICRAVEQVLVASMDTRTFAINRPVALAAGAAADAAPPAAAGGSGSSQAADNNAAADGDDDAAAAPGADGDSTQQQQRQGSMPLKPLNGKPGGAAAAAGQFGSQGANGKPRAQAVAAYRPERLVRTDHRTQSIEGFLVARAPAAAAATAAAAAVAGGSKRRRSSAPSGAAAAAAGAPGLSALLGDDEGGDDGVGAFSNASLHLQAAAAEEAAAAAELTGDLTHGRQQQQQRQALLRPVAQPRLPPVVTQLTSVRELLADVAAGAHGELQQLFRSHTWVGMADERLALLQHGTRLYLADVSAVTADLFYQLLLARWEAVPLLALAQPLHVGQLMGLALAHEEAAGRWQPEPGATRAELCELVQNLLAQKADMLREYAGLVFVQQPSQPSQPAAADQPQPQPASIDQPQPQPLPAAEEEQQQGPGQQDQQGQQQQGQQGQQGLGLYLSALPLLLEGYVPDLAGLPHLILALARDVDWDTEKECFQSLATAVAQFYALQPLLPAADTAGPAHALTAPLPPPPPAVAAAAPEGGLDADASGTGGGAAAGGSAGAAGLGQAAGSSGDQGPQPMQVDGGSAADTRSDALEQQQQQQQCVEQQDEEEGKQQPGSSSSSGGGGSSLLAQAGHRGQAQREWLLRHVVMPAVKRLYRPPRERARDGSVLLLTSMEKLYRVFERCGW